MFQQEIFKLVSSLTSAINWLSFEFSRQSCGMSRAVNINLQFLQVLVKLKPSPRLTLLRIADESLVTAICECFLNIVNANVPLTTTQRQQLEKYKQPIRALASSKGSWKAKRTLLVKHGEKLVPLAVSIALEYLKNESR